MEHEITFTFSLYILDDLFPHSGRIDVQGHTGLSMVWDAEKEKFEVDPFGVEFELIDPRGESISKLIFWIKSFKDLNRNCEIYFSEKVEISSPDPHISERFWKIPAARPVAFSTSKRRSGPDGVNLMFSLKDFDTVLELPERLQTS